MKYYEWKKVIINRYQKDNDSRLRQFNINKIDETDLLFNNFLINNIYAINRNNHFDDLNYPNENTAIIVGFGNCGALHIGHFLLVKELLFYVNNNSKIYFVNLDPDNDNRFVYKIVEILRINYFGKINYEILTGNDINIMRLKKQIASNLNINVINRIMGWENENLQSYEKVLDMLATFSLSNLILEKNKIVITDINQAIFYGLLKNIENKLQIELPNFTYHLLLPSIKTPTERMSIKKTKSLIFVDEEESLMEEKLMCSFTGNIDKQYTCTLLRIIDLVSAVDYTDEVIMSCEKYNSICLECKKNNISKLVKKIKNKRIG